MPGQATVEDAGPDVAALLDGWATGHGPLARRLAYALRQLIEAGVLRPGSRLPAERVLARQLSVSRTVVTEALDELRGERRLRSVRGSGTYVVGPSSPARLGTRVAEHLSSGPGIDLAKGDAPDLSHLPPVSVEMWQLNATCGGAAVNTAGLPEMRAAVAGLYARGGTTGRARPTEPEQVHVTAGSHQASRLLVGALAPRGAGVALAEYSYAGLYDILEGCEVEAVPVQLDRAGMVPESLERVLERSRPAVVYVQAGPQIPTGCVATDARLRALAAVLDRFEATVIEDTTLAAFAFDRRVRLLADHCRVATVVTTGSLSKLCWSGIRIGWIRGPAAVVDATVYGHLSVDLGPSVPSQVLAMALLPHLEVIAERRREQLRTAVDAALDQLAEFVPDAAVDRPAGGSILWARFPVADATELVRAARRHGVRVAPGGIHAAGKVPGPFVRIDVDRPPGHVREGIDRLARAWHERRGSELD